MTYDLLFKAENISYMQLENELSKQPLLNEIINNGIINDDSYIEHIYKNEKHQLYSYTVNFNNNTYLFYEKVQIIEYDNGKTKHGNYISCEIYHLLN